MTTKTHWKQLVNPDYFGAYALPNGQDLVVKITQVKRQVVTSTGGKKEECTIALLEGLKPLILNRTNSKMIQKLFGTPYIEEWAGKSIQLYAATTRLAGDEVECIRIRPTLPGAAKPTLQASDTINYGNVLKAVKNGYTFQQIEQKWTITDAVKQKLIDDASNS